MADQRYISIANAVVTILPSVVGLVQALFRRQHPGVPPPTSEEVLLTFQSACARSLAVDEAWLAAHPER